MEKLWPDLCREYKPEVEKNLIETNQLISKARTAKLTLTTATSHTATLYTDNTQLKSNEDGDLWDQYELAKKESDAQQWKKVDQSQRPVAEMELEPALKKNKTRSETMKNFDESSLLFKYWATIQSKQTPKEFDGRLEN